jgi:3-hydroxymyristoyl/3-hydroxydecanoyl-(acyl carrier protein) dehydratase
MFVIIENILSLIPQAPPFVMIDSLQYSNESVTRTAFQVRANNIFVKNEMLIEAGLVENIAQTAAARAGYESKMEHQPVSIGYIGSVNNLVIHALPKTGDQLETEIKVVNQIFNVTLITGKIRLKGELLAQCEMKIFTTQTK